MLSVKYLVKMCIGPQPICDADYACVGILNDFKKLRSANRRKLFHP